MGTLDIQALGYIKHCDKVAWQYLSWNTDIL